MIKKIFIFVSIVLVILFGLATYRYLTSGIGRAKAVFWPLFCLKEGEPAENASMGPSGYFGKCCPGLEPLYDNNAIIDETVNVPQFIPGNAAYCVKK